MRAALVLALAALACAAVLLLAPCPGGQLVAPGATATAEPGPSVELRAPVEAELEVEPRREEPESASAEAPAPEPSAASAGAAPPRVDLVARFVAPDGARLRVERARVICSQDGSPPRAVTVVDAEEALVPGLEAREVHVGVEAPWLDHRPQTFDLARAGRDEQGRVEERVWLWPEAWIAVRATTRDGQPFDALAEAFALEPGQLFVDAFEARAVAEPPPDRAWPPEPDPPLARWGRPPRYKSWSLPGACVGSLEVLQEPRGSLWVGLRLFDGVVGWRHVAPQEREVVFELDAELVASRLARVQLRAVDAGGAPLAAARVTLKADTSAHRRKDLDRAAPDGVGHFALERVVPGRYELLLVHGEVAHQQRLELEPGEERDLGDVVLDFDAAVVVRAVDPAGEATPAFIEVAPYERGGLAEELYPPNLWRHARGDYRLPMPTGVSIVRARGYDRSVAPYPTTMSPSALLDPERPPTAPLVLVVHAPQDVPFQVAVADAAVLEVLDALELVVARRELLPEPASRDLDLVPGLYTARLRTADGALLLEGPFQVPLGAPGLVLR